MPATTSLMLAYDQEKLKITDLSSWIADLKKTCGETQEPFSQWLDYLRAMATMPELL